MSWEEGRLSHLAGARIDVREVLRQVENGTCTYYTKAEVLEELDDIDREARALRRRQPAPAPAPASRTRGSVRPAAPVQNRRKPLIKSLIGAAVIGADVLFGMAAPEVIRGLHAETRPHLYGTVAVYAVLLLLTLWVIASVVRTVSGSGKPAPRPAGGYPHGRGGGL